MIVTDRPSYAFYILSVICVLSLSLNLLLLFQRNHPESRKSFKLLFIDVPPVTSADHIRGYVEAPIAIEYSDFQCPFCGQLHSNLKTLSEARKIRWVFRNRPLDSIHPLATKAAIAAECADQQGKFWEYADALFEQQQQINSEGIFYELGHHLNLDPAKFKRCQESEISALVRGQTQKAAALEIDETPTLFIDGKRYTGVLTPGELSKIVDQKRR